VWEIVEDAGFLVEEEECVESVKRKEAGLGNEYGNGTDFLLCCFCLFSSSF